MLRLAGLVGGVLAAAAIAASGYGYAAATGRAVSEYGNAMERYEALQCIGSQILDGVPPDGSFVVGALPQDVTIMWRQWLTELASPQRRVVIDPGDADFLVVLVIAGPRAACGRYGVDVVRMPS